MSVMHEICADLRAADDQLVHTVQKTVKERLAETLIYLHTTYGVNNDNTMKIQLTREELASLIGTATESCIRLLSEFKKMELIAIKESKIVLKNIPKLKKIAEH